MNISSLNEYSSLFLNYNVPSIPAQKSIIIEEKPTQDYALQNPVADIHDGAVAEVAPRSSARLEDISITFNKQEEFDYIGQDSDIRSLDMDRAISDMKKDQVLQQYQYFVGSSKNVLPDSSEGVVFAKF